MTNSTNPFNQPLSEQVWHDTYKWETDKTVFDTFSRISKHVASIEKDKSLWQEKYYELLSQFKYVPGGRISSNAGTGLSGTSFVNCFVSGFRGKDQDSINSIYEELSRQAKILKSEGGYGINFDTIRPRGSYIHGIGVESPGAVEIMNLWDTSSNVITSGSGNKSKKGKNKIRKGAMMGVMSCWHPSIEEFIVAKQQPGKLTKFNLSVLVTDDFMKAVKKKSKWKLEFPDTTFEKYNSEWDGNLKDWKDKNYPTIVSKEFEDANELWDLVLESTYNRAEPGILFGDRINHLNNLQYLEYISATNPCGEQPLQTGGSCVLSSLNLVQYINESKTDFDYDKLKEDIPTMVRFLDAINDITEFPLKEQKVEALGKRRIGLGYLGYGSALYMLKVAYGSEKALKITKKLAKFVTNTIYQASSELAKEKGSFPVLEIDKYLESNFIKQALTDETVELIKKNGIRNSHLTTIAPTGNSSIYANCVSGGIEPVVSHKYTRTVIVPFAPDEMVMPENIDWDKHTCDLKEKWKWITEGDEFLLSKIFNGTIYKIDRNRGLTKEEDVYDYSVLEMGDDFEIGAEYGKTLFDLSVDEHIETMKIFAKYVDSAISKTINVPNDYSYDEFKGVYTKAYETGHIKGITTYRMGTMTSVISVDKEEKQNAANQIIQCVAPERPISLHCHVHRIKVKGHEWYIFVGLMDGKPYEVFAGIVHDVILAKSIKEGAIIKSKSSKYQFEHDGEVLIKDMIKVFANDEYESITRLISASLRHGTPIEFIVNQLTKSKGTIVDFSKSIIRALKKYITDGSDTGDKCPECSGNLVYIEGCNKCTDCGWSKCS